MNLTYQDVADFILAKFAEIKGSDTVTPMQLQKLVFYAQGIHLALYDEALFYQEIQAWEYGPVIKPMYHKYKDCGDSAIQSKVMDNNKYNENIRLFLSAICVVFLSYSAYQLSNMTHNEAPWKNAYVERENNKITIESMKDFFQTSKYLDKVKECMETQFNFNLEHLKKRIEEDDDIEVPIFENSGDFFKWIKTL